MRAHDIVEGVPTVTADDPVAAAVRLMARTRLPGLIVVDTRSVPTAVLPGTQVLRMTVPRSHQAHPSLARTIDEPHADLFWSELGDRTVGECLPDRPERLAVIAQDATLLEAAALMGRARSPLLAVVGDDGRLLGGVVLGRLLAALSQASPEG
ncbi:CBS domain-containing protein [Pseudonocardia ammonioxydans]|uniref:CBS domain-containing protein n=1 Tax=Pseudonocardia ammonioxydans TaxID=260086 RepID=A0A1I4YJJ0_PSUAM|nr:CBS domain-containing protein [Pseudonocardia ammonioxydans]SFN38147.1 CBS domain-containing protein [Pseudonocardia ammonioxydans]